LYERHWLTDWLFDSIIVTGFSGMEALCSMPRQIEVPVLTVWYLQSFQSFHAVTCTAVDSHSPLSSNRQHELFMSGGKRGDYQNCSVLYYVLKLCAVISTLRWAVLTVLWIRFRYTGPISLCVDLFVFFCVYFVCFRFILHSCCIIVSTVGWTWWDWRLLVRTYLPSVLWHCWLGHLTRKNLSLVWSIMCLVGC